MKTMNLLNGVSICLTVALASSCASMRARRTVQSALELVDGGVAIGTIASSGSDSFSLRLECNDPAQIAFHITDDLGRELERGEFRNGVHSFGWTPMNRKVIVEVRASGAARASVAYEVTSFAPISIAWDLSHALAPTR